jgi:uncharacterized protein (DUF1330 family)
MSTDVRARLDAALERISQARAAFDKATRDLDWQHVNDNANWSILDHVRHVAHPGAYPAWIKGLATDDQWAPPDQSGPGGYWRWTRNNALKVLDDVAAFVVTLSDYSLTRKAKMGSRELDVIDMLNGLADHYQHHAKDIEQMAAGGQAQPHDAKPAYVIAELDIFDPEAYKAYNDAAGPTVRAHGGSVVAMTDTPEQKEGEVRLNRVVVIRFPSMEDARRWYHSPEYTAAVPLRQRAARGTVSLIEGR